MEHIEEVLDRTITALRNDGASYEDLISAFELKIMALKEEHEAGAED